MFSNKNSKKSQPSDKKNEQEQQPSKNKNWHSGDKVKEAVPAPRVQKRDFNDFEPDNQSYFNVGKKSAIGDKNQATK